MAESLEQDAGKHGATLDAQDVSAEQPLAHGYRLHQDASHGQLSISAPDGTVCLDIKVTRDGLKVSLDSAALAVQTSGPVSLDCGEFDVKASGDIRLSAGGSIVSEAEQQRHSASIGDMTLEANDDVVLDGERVRLNSPDTHRQAPAQHETLTEMAVGATERLIEAAPVVDVDATRDA